MTKTADIKHGAKFTINGTTYRVAREERASLRKLDGARYSLMVRDESDEDRPWTVRVHQFHTAEAVAHWLAEQTS